jgi:uncharacterized protein (DUF58 family)
VNYRPGIGWNAVTPASGTRSLTVAAEPNPRVSSSLTVTPANPVAGQNVTAAFQIRNDADAAVNVGLMTVAARGPQGQNLDFTSDTNVTIQPNSTYTFSKTKALPYAGNYTFDIVNYRSGSGWSARYPQLGSGITGSTTASLGANPLVVTPLGLSPANPIAGQNVTASFQLRNDADAAVNVGLMAVAVRGPQGQNLDYVPDSDVTIQPNSTYTYSKTQVLPYSGGYSFDIVNYRPSAGWSTSYPAANTGVARLMARTVGQNPVISTPLSISPANPVAGQNVTASFEITNDGDTPMSLGLMAVAVRDPLGRVADFAGENNVVVAPNSTYTYTATRAFSMAGKHDFSIVNYRPSSGWSDKYPATGSGVARTLSKIMGQNPFISASLGLSPSSPSVGQNVTATFQIRNDSEAAVNVGLMAVAVRGPQGQNLDYLPDTSVNIQPHTTYTYSKVQAFAQPGVYSFQVVNYRAGIGWTTLYPSLAPSITGSATLNVAP